jgi:hypothetical protein
VLRDAHVLDDRNIFSSFAPVAASFPEDANDLQTSLSDLPERVSNEVPTKVMGQVVEDYDPRLLVVFLCARVVPSVDFSLCSRTRPRVRNGRAIASMPESNVRRDSLQ